MKTYKYTDTSNQVVHVIEEDGKSYMSMLAAMLPEDTLILPADEMSPHIPNSITRAQGKMALILAGLWPSVINFINTIEDPEQKALAEVEINDSQRWYRGSEFLQQTATELGLDAETLDNLFITAASLRS